MKKHGSRKGVGGNRVLREKARGRAFEIAEGRETTSRRGRRAKRGDRLGRAHVARLVGAGLGDTGSRACAGAGTEAARSSRAAVARCSPGVLLTSVSSSTTARLRGSHVRRLVHDDRSRRTDGKERGGGAFIGRGPFWVCCTLVFSIGIFSNIAQYIENQGGAGEYGSDFRMVTGATSLISAYVLIVPLIISTTLWYRKADIQYSFLEVVCAYGYSLAIFIPVSMFWVIDIAILRWALIFVSVALSGGVLVRTLAPAFANDPNKLIALGSVIIVIVLHFGLALCFKEFYFDAAMPSKAVIPAPTAAPIGVTVPDEILGENPPAIVTGGVAGGEKNESKPEAAALIAAPPHQETTASNTATVAAKIEKRDNSTVVEEKGEKKTEEVKTKVEEKKEAPSAVSSSSTKATTVTAEKKEKAEGISVNSVSNATVLGSEPTVVTVIETTKANSTL